MDAIHETPRRKEKKTRVIKIRATDTQLQALTAAADEKGLSGSEYARQAIGLDELVRSYLENGRKNVP